MSGSVLEALVGIGSRGRLAAAVVAFGVAGAALGWYASREPYSNIHPDDYVGPEVCGDCHADHHRDNYESWLAHSHRTMNQNPSDESVQGDFSGVEVHYDGGTAVFHRSQRGHYVMSIFREGSLLRRHVVTRTVGSRYVQYYIGTQVSGPEPPGHPTYRFETKLPFGWSVALQKWLPEVYFDSTVGPESNFLEDPGADYIYAMAPNHLWNTSCLRCHNTYAYAERLKKYPDSFETEGVNWFGGFPEDGVDWNGSTAHEGGVQLAYGLRALHGSDLVTVGISCESCHFGGREHAERERAIRFVPTAPGLEVRDPRSGRPLESDRDDPAVINSICAQCHNADLHKYPDGSHAVNSSEALAMLAGGCSGTIKCTDCHSPHEAGPPSGSPDLPGHVEACLKCHPGLGDAAARARHTRHGETVNCLDCHMPRSVAGLDTMARSHFITRPSDARMLGAHAPNPCNLCHLERSIDWTLQELERGWGVQADVWAEAPMTDEQRAAPLGEQWLRSPIPYLRAATAEAWARSTRVERRLPALLVALDDANAYNRTFALIVLERLLGREVSEAEYDLLAQGEARAAQLAALRETLAGRL